jgi:hypothetical protein
MEKTKRPRVSRAEWAKRVERWKDSGLSAEEFSSELGINARTLIYWKYTLSREARGGSPRAGQRPPRQRQQPVSAPRFIEVSALAEASGRPAPGLVLEAPGGYRVVVPEQFKTEHLAQLLQVLERRQ